MRTGIVIGLGETGRPLFEILKEAYPDMLGRDKPAGDWDEPVEFMHICIPYGEDFIEIVKTYQKIYKPDVTIIHSTVPIGTTAQIPNAVHSPIQGRHKQMKEDLLKYKKWISGPLANDAHAHMKSAGLSTQAMSTDSRVTEKLKLMCLAKYGVSLAFAQYQKQAMGDDYYYSYQWDKDYNEYVGEGLQRPIFGKLTDKIGGHCVTQNTRILNEQHPNPMLDEVLKYAEEPDVAPAVWEPCNIYPSAKIGKNVSIGAFSEIGRDVVIGDNVRIGAHAFIPEGVTIEDDVFIGPRCTFANDKYPPSGKENWDKTLVKRGARIGAAVCILPGIIIGENAVIGMGATVTKDVNDNAEARGHAAIIVEEKGALQWKL